MQLTKFHRIKHTTHLTSGANSDFHLTSRFLGVNSALLDCIPENLTTVVEGIFI